MQGFLDDGGSGIGPSGFFHLSGKESFFVWLRVIGDKICSGIIPCGRLTDGVDDLEEIFDEA